MDMHLVDHRAVIVVTGILAMAVANPVLLIFEATASQSISKRMEHVLPTVFLLVCVACGISGGTLFGWVFWARWPDTPVVVVAAAVLCGAVFAWVLVLFVLAAAWVTFVMVEEMFRSGQVSD